MFNVLVLYLEHVYYSLYRPHFFLILGHTFLMWPIFLIGYGRKVWPIIKINHTCESVVFLLLNHIYLSVANKSVV